MKTLYIFQHYTAECEPKKIQNWSQSFTIIWLWNVKFLRPPPFFSPSFYSIAVTTLHSCGVNCPFKPVSQCSEGTFMTDVIISQHIIRATSLSCCQVTSAFRLRKPMRYILRYPFFPNLWSGALSVLFFSRVSDRNWERALLQEAYLICIHFNLKYTNTSTLYQNWRCLVSQSSTSTQGCP